MTAVLKRSQRAKGVCVVRTRFGDGPKAAGAEVRRAGFVESDPREIRVVSHLITRAHQPR